MALPMQAAPLKHQQLLIFPLIPSAALGNSQALELEKPYKVLAPERPGLASCFAVRFMLDSPMCPSKYNSPVLFAGGERNLQKVFHGKMSPRSVYYL